MIFSDFETRWSALDHKPNDEWNSQDETIEALMDFWSSQMHRRMGELAHPSLSYDDARAESERYANHAVEIVTAYLELIGEL